MHILIGADIVPTEKNMAIFASGKIDSLIDKELEKMLEQSDFRIFNLEVPLTDIISPIEKCGVALSAPTKCINGIKALHADLVTLGNNHIMDQGDQGLGSTINTLQNAHISYVGAGFSKEEAAKPYIFNCDEKKIGVYACAEHEFSIVNDNMPGANPIDLLNCFDQVRELKKECDYVIVLYHGGKEQYRYPSPYLQKICHKFIDVGSDLVVCQHSHCIGCEEKYKQKTIVYGQGNFLFEDVDNEYWRTSILIQISNNFDIKYVPLQKTEIGVRVASSSECEEIMTAFYKRSQEIMKPGFVQEKYDELAKNYIVEFLSIASGKRYGLITRIINKIIGNNKIIRYYIEKKYTDNKLLTLLNRIECEAYQELFVSGLKSFIKGRK